MRWRGPTTTGSPISAAAAPRRLFAAAMLPLQDMDFALAELRRVAGIPCFRGAFIRPMFFEGRYFTHPYYDPLWAELERLGLVAAVHPTPGLWNPEWTSHGPFVREGEEPCRSSAAAGRRRRSIRRRRRGLASTSFFTALPQLGHPMAPILSGWLDNHMFVASVLIGFTVMQRFPGDEGRGRARQGLVDGGGAGEDGGLLPRDPAAAQISGAHRHRGDVGRGQGDARASTPRSGLIQKLPHDFAEKVVWGSRYPQHDTTSARRDRHAAREGVPDDIIARMMGGNAASQFRVVLAELGPGPT